jgi:hypothetical protein
MKLRMDNQQIVFRLLEGEKEKLMADRELAIMIDLAHRSLHYKLRLDADIEAIAIAENNNDLVVSMPEKYMKVWDDVKVGFEEKIAFDSGKELEIIVEKDLKRSKHREK